MATISEALNDLAKAIGEAKLDLDMDDEDLTVFALNYLGANLDHAFEPQEKMYEFTMAFIGYGTTVQEAFEDCKNNIEPESLELENCVIQRELSGKEL